LRNSQSPVKRRSRLEIHKDSVETLSGNNKIHFNKLIFSSIKHIFYKKYFSYMNMNLIAIKISQEKKNHNLNSENKDKESKLNVFNFKIK